MEPQIQYTQTTDGVSIAYAAVGSGGTLLWMDLPYSNVHAEWADPNTRADYESNATIATHVRYDHRGFGLSDRHVRDFSLDAMVRDLEAVVDRLDAQRLNLIAWRGMNTPIAVTYAARHPERVSRLVLAQGAARMPANTRDAVTALLKLLPDWRFVTESVSRMMQGWDNDESSRQLAALLRESIDPDAFVAFWEAASNWDVTDLLPQIETPTLLVHWKDHPLFGPEHGRLLASKLPNARSAIIDGASPHARAVQYQEVFRAFFGTGPPDSYTSRGQRSPAPSASGTAIILFTDIVDSTALTERIGDAAFRDKARDLDDALRAVVHDHGGEAIKGKLLGDGILATFPSASQAIDAALHCSVAGEDGGLPLHIGLHAGDVIREDGNVFGGAVNIAARISSLSAPGEVLVSDIVRGLARTSAGVTFADRGEHALKGIADTQRVYAVSPSPLVADAAPEVT